jgi:hypothetical protein
MSQPYPQYEPPQNFASPRRSGSGWKWVVALGLVGGGLLLGCCLSGGALVVFGLGVVAEQVADELRDNPIVQRELGGIEEIRVDYAASMARDDDDEYVYKVEGPKGKGTLVAKSNSNDDGGEDIVSASLRTSDGRTLQLVP